MPPRRTNAGSRTRRAAGRTPARFPGAGPARATPAPSPPAAAPAGGEPAVTWLELDVGPVAHGGICVARVDGRVVFVRHALPGERVRAVVTDRSHDRYWRADAIEVITPSADRVAAPCPHAGPLPPPSPTAAASAAQQAAAAAAAGWGCGGCDWQHASLPAQRRLKAQVVVDALRRLGGLAAHVAPDDDAGWRTAGTVAWPAEAPTPADGEARAATPADGTAAPGPDSLAVAVAALPGPGERDGLGWRTRMRFAVTPDGQVGLRAHRSHLVVPTPDCRIAHPLVVAKVADRRFPRADAVEVAASLPSGRVWAGPVRRPDDQPPPGAGALGRGREGTAARAPSDEPEVLVEQVRDRRFEVATGAFWQVHPAAAELLVAEVLAALAPRPGETAFDLYAGAGLFAAFLAEAVGAAGTVVAFESDRAAARSATRSLADLPQVSVRPVRVTPASVRGALGSAGAGRRVDVAVLDPPRAGAGPEVMAALLEQRPRAVAYVACDPAALARDLAAALALGYRVTAVRGFDLFPMTAHVECVARLEPAEPG
ncbi:MAG: class I SAM-dependent RNA methyltransferase [Frankia sp.]|nr:class I SAM-dependent RNA methyltransferase [Frankia sp.]